VSKPVLAPITNGGGSSVSFTLANTGNTRQSPTVNVWVTDVFGRTVKDFSRFRVPDLVPGSQSDIVKSWSGGAGLGLRLTAHVSVESPSATTEATTNELVVPWLLVVLVLVLVALAVSWWVRRRRARPPREPAPAGS